jgi:hypothetical protein
MNYENEWQKWYRHNSKSSKFITGLYKIYKLSRTLPKCRYFFLNLTCDIFGDVPFPPPWYPSPPCSPPLRPAPAAPPGSGCQGLHPKRPGRPNPQGPWKNGWKIRTSSDVFFWVIFMNISSLEDFDDFAFLGVARKLPDGMLQLELSWTLRKSYL